MAVDVWREEEEDRQDACWVEMSKLASHPRSQDITPRETVRQVPKCDREVTMYGYLRGTNIKPGARVHIAGVGDYTIQVCDIMCDIVVCDKMCDIMSDLLSVLEDGWMLNLFLPSLPQELDALPDPCPLPDTIKKRGLNERERLLYAPMADVGGLLYDKDAVYIDIPDWKVRRGNL